MGGSYSRADDSNPSRREPELKSGSVDKLQILAEPLDINKNEEFIIGKNNKGQESDSSEEEKESFQSWVKTSGTASARGGSLESQPSPTPPSRMSSNHSDSHGASSSSAWLGNRPSADTPLRPPSIGAGSTHQGKRPSMDGGPQQQGGSLASRSSASSARRDSAASGETVSPAASARSSFALERASLEANRLSLEAFQGAVKWQPSQSGAQEQGSLPSERPSDGVSLDVLMQMTRIPPELKDRYAALCVLPLQTPAPASMLSLLWNASEDDVDATLAKLAARSIVNIARLPSGQVWALPQVQHLQILQVACKDIAQSFHARLLDAYAAGIVQTKDREAAFPQETASLANVPDDGYVLANISHHLHAAGRVDTARDMLLDPGWLERKLLVCGPGAAVADFRRFLMGHPDKEVKLILEAFQMSVGLVLSHPEVPGLLRCMVTARLMAVPLSPAMQAWLIEQQDLVHKEGVRATAQGKPRPLPPHTPSLDQAGGLQRLALKGHRGPVSRILLTPSGTDAISASSDGTIRVWDLEIGDCVLVLEGHSGPVRDMSITNDGSLLVTCSSDGTVRAYELEQGQCLRVLAGHEGAVNKLVIDPQGRFVVTAGADGTARVWDLASARTLHSLPAPGGCSALSLSTCTRYLLVGCADSSLRMYDVVSGQAMGTMKGHEGPVSAVAFIPSGSAAGSGKRALSASHDGTLRVWSLRTGQCIRLMDGHVGRINALEVSKDGKMAITAGDDCTARVWDVRTGTCRRVLKGHRAWVSHAALSPSNERVVTTSGDGTAIAWNVDTGEVVRVLEGHSAAVLCAVITRRGRFAVTGSEDGGVRVWDFTASSSHTPRWHEGRIQALAGRDGVVVATAGEDCDARLWDSALGEYRGLLRRHIVPIRWAQFSLDGTMLVTASPDRAVYVWDAVTSELLHELPVHKGSRMKSFAASGDLTTAVVCLFDSTVTVWDLVAGQPTVKLQRWGERDESKGHSSAVNEVFMTSDGSLVVTVAKDATARVWDATTGACRHVLRGHSDGIAGGCISDEARLVATHSYDGTVKLWSLDDGRCMGTLTMDTRVTKMALSRCGGRVAVALEDGKVFSCSISPESPPGNNTMIKIGGHDGEVTGLTFSWNEDLLVTCSLDGTARLLGADTGALIGLFVSDCGLTCCHYDSVTGCIIAGTDRGVVHFVVAGGNDKF